MHRTLAAGLFCLTLAALAAGEDKPAKKWEAPPVPDGWQAVTATDQTYRFALPKKRDGVKTSTQTTTVNGVKTESKTHRFLVGKTAYTVRVLSPGVAKGRSADAALDAAVAAERDDGFAAPEPKAVVVNGAPGREYRFTKELFARRVVLVAAPPNLYAFEVAAADGKSADPAELDGPAADTFLKSLVVVPPDVARAILKDRADEAEKLGQEHLKKYGARWTDDVKALAAPASAPAGVVRGKEFRPDRVTLGRDDKLVFRQGRGDVGDAAISLWITTPKEGETIVVGAGADQPATRTPFVYLDVVTTKGKKPAQQSFLRDYTLKLTFGTKDADGNLPGTIHLCLPDGGKSFLAGTFTAKVAK